MEIFNTILVITLAIVLFVKQWRSGGKTIDNETIESLKRSYDAIKLEISNYQAQVQELTLKIGEQSGIIKMQEATIAKYEKILENRNPELLAVLGEIRDFMKGLEAHNVKAMAELKAQSVVLNRQEIRHTAVVQTDAALLNS